MKYNFRVFAFLLFLFSSTFLFGQATITSSFSNNLTACLNEATYTVSVKNITPYNFHSLQVKLHLPEGVEYVPSSVTGGAETGFLAPDTLLFSMQNVPSNSERFFTVRIKAGCMQNYTAKKNVFKLSYIGDNGIGGVINQTQIHQSNLYTIGQPDLALTAMTNQSFSGTIGDVFTRCITITNGGSGALATFDLEHVHGTGLVIQSSSIGTSTTNANGTLHTLGAADFVSIGNGNNTFDPGETITLCESISIVSCSQAQSTYNYRWGCNGEVCQQLSDAGNIVFAAETPNLVVTTWNSFTSNSTNGLGANCYGNNANGDFPSSMTISNTGTGDAVNASIDILSGWAGITGWAPVYNYYSSFNLSSLTISINGGAPQPITPTSTSNGYGYSCLPPNPVNGFTLTIPLIAPGDVVVIRWNHYTCCTEDCSNGERRHLLHWRTKGSYENNCQTEYVIPQIDHHPGLSGAFYYRNQLNADIVPGTMTAGQTSTITFMAVNAEFPLPRNSSDQFKYRLILPDACLSVDPNSMVIKNHLGVVVNVTPTIVMLGDTVDFVFNSIAVDDQWTVALNLMVNCASCPIQGMKNIQFQSLYSPGSHCGCWMLFGCTTANIDVQCPPLCEGTNLVATSIRRTNLGLVDNDNNGIPDGGIATHNMNNVRTDRMMMGDTLEINNRSAVQNSNNVNFNAVVVNHQMTSHGQRMQYVNSDVSIFKANTGMTYSVQEVNIGLTVNTTGTTRNWKHGFDIHTLAGLGFPAGVHLETGDSVIVYSKFVNTINNNTNLLDVVNTASKMFATANPTFATAPAADLIGCNTINREFTLIGYYYTNYGEEQRITQNCDRITLAQNYYLSIGPCCNNYNGGNLFPFEYRHWSTPSSMFVQLPDDYRYVSAIFNFAATGGTLSTRPDYVQTFNITPVSVNGLIYEFDLSPFFGNAGSGAPILFGDDGFHGSIQVVIEPTCNVENGTKSARYRWNFDPIPSIANGSENGSWLVTDPLTYNGPILTMQSNILSVNSQSGQETWDLFFQNTSFHSAANNFWIGAPTNGAIHADSILNTSTNLWYFPNANGIFDIPDLAANTSVTYRLYTSMTSCQTSTLPIYAGWGCSGTPSTLSDYECTPLQISITIHPLTPSFEAHIMRIGNGDADLCEELEFEVLIRNFQLGYGFDLIADIQLPYALQLINGSSTLISQGVTTSLNDPTLLSGSTFRWDLGNTPLSQNGLIGIVDETNNFYRIRFKAMPLCGFNSGQRIFVRGAGESFCGSTHQSEQNYSTPIFLNNMTVPYTTDIRIGIDFITPCGPNNQTVLAIRNNGANPFGTADSIHYVLPAGLTYEPNSFNAIHNAGIAQTEPTIINTGSQMHLVWPLQAGVAMGDSMVFQINLTPNPSQIPCEDTQLRAFTNVLMSATCAIDGNTCEAGLITGETSKDIYVYKTELEMIAASANVHLNADGSETLSGSFTLYNQGAALSSNYSLVYEVLQDANNDGISNVGDVIVSTQTTSANIAGGQSQTFNFSGISVSNYCGGSIRLLLVNNACFCSDNVFVFNVTTSATNFTDTVCSQIPLVIGNPDLGGFTYNWTPPVNLSSTTIDRPTFTGINTTNSPQITTYIRTVNKGFCTHIDTNKIVVNPLPFASILTNDTLICQNTNPLLVPIVASNSSPDYTLNYTVNGIAQSATFNDTTHYNLTTTNPGVYQIELLTITDGSNRACSQDLNETTSITINPAPTAQSFGDTTVCLNTTGINLTLIGASATAEYTFTYILEGDTLQVQTVNGTSEISVPTTSPGTFTYTTISIEEASAGQCQTTLNLTNQFTVLPLPQAQLTMDTVVCQNDAPFLINMVGSNATAPYTFNYTLNGITQSGIGNSTLSLNQSTQIPDTFIYHLTTITDNSIRACSSTIDTSITVIVNPLPTAQIIGDTTVCHFSTAPNVTFVGTNGTAPYTFIYTYNNDTLQVVASTDTISIAISTAQVGSYPIELLEVIDASTTTCSNIIQSTVVVTVLPNPLAQIGSSTVVCQNDTEPLVTFTGSNASPNYTFGYEINGVPYSSVSNGNEAQISIPTTTADTFIIHLKSVQDASIRTCSTILDTSVIVVVNPLPLVTISGSTTVCQLDTNPVVTFTASNASAPYWVYFTLNGIADSLQTTGNIANYTVPTSIPATYAFVLTGIKDSSPTGCFQTVNGNATVVVQPRPTASLLGNAELCQDSGDVEIQFIGYGTTSPYTFEYTLNGVQNTATSVGDTATVVLSSQISGTYNYVLNSVTDATINQCFRDTMLQVTVQINQLPIASISGDASICLNTTPATIQFVGEMGTAGYTFHYEIIETNQTLTVNSGTNTFTSIPSINNPAGTYTYVLTGVTDASSTQCYNAQIDTVVIHVIDLPTASIVGFDPLCEDQPEPLVLFSGANGGSPFTFEYTLNGEPMSVSTNNGDSTVSVNQPTNQAGTFNYTLIQVTESTYGCSTTLNTGFTGVIHPKPLPSFTFTPQEIILSNSTVHFSNHSTGANAYTWDFGDSTFANTTHPIHHYAVDAIENIRITLYATSEFGCVDSVTNIVVVKEDILFYVPNTFTPNADMHNNVFKPIITEGIDAYGYSFTVFNRWGELIFESKDIDTGWDGTYKGIVCQDGTYSYILVIKHKEDATVKKYTGHVNLLK